VTQRLRQIFGGKPPNWTEKISEYESRLTSGHQKLQSLRDERMTHALAAAEADPVAQKALSRIAAEVAVIERDQAVLVDALADARECLLQQQERESADQERKRQAEYKRLAGELLSLDARADSLFAGLRDVLDARNRKIEELKAIVGADRVKLLTSRNHVERVAKRNLRGHIVIDSVIKSDDTLVELDGRVLNVSEAAAEVA
jgi:hypothetical protein